MKSKLATEVDLRAEEAGRLEALIRKREHEIYDEAASDPDLLSEILLETSPDLPIFLEFCESMADHLRAPDSLQRLQDFSDCANSFLIVRSYHIAKGEFK